ncbi:hypothetical protein EDD15DRAFT_2517060 [Pisolithus albus]|nr:hypothetical protein EDD15DRAFT_2517060 [Pisolithus albus]
MGGPHSKLRPAATLLGILGHAIKEVYSILFQSLFRPPYWFGNITTPSAWWRVLEHTANFPSSTTRGAGEQTNAIQLRCPTTRSLMDPVDLTGIAKLCHFGGPRPWQGMDPASDALQYRRADFRITPAVVQMVIIPIFGNPAKTGYAASPPTTPAMDHPESSHPRGLASTAYGEPTSSCHRLTKNGTTAAIQYISLPSVKSHEYSALNAARSSTMTPRSMDDDGIPMFETSLATKKVHPAKRPSPGVATSTKFTFYNFKPPFEPLRNNGLMARSGNAWSAGVCLPQDTCQRNPIIDPITTNASNTTSTVVGISKPYLFLKRPGHRHHRIQG